MTQFPGSIESRRKKATTAVGSKSSAMASLSETSMSMTLTQLIRLLSESYRVFCTEDIRTDRKGTFQSRTIALSGVVFGAMVLVRVSLREVTVDKGLPPKLYTLDPCYIETAREGLAALESRRDGIGGPKWTPVNVQDLLHTLKYWNG